MERGGKKTDKRRVFCSCQRGSSRVIKRNLCLRFTTADDGYKGSSEFVFCKDCNKDSLTSESNAYRRSNSLKHKFFFYFSLDLAPPPLSEMSQVPTDQVPVANSRETSSPSTRRRRSKSADRSKGKHGQSSANSHRYPSSPTEQSSDSEYESEGYSNSESEEDEEKKPVDKSNGFSSDSVTSPTTGTHSWPRFGHLKDTLDFQRRGEILEGRSVLTLLLYIMTDSFSRTKLASVNYMFQLFYENECKLYDYYNNNKSITDGKVQELMNNREILKKEILKELGVAYTDKQVQSIALSTSSDAKKHNDDDDS